jgi:aquaporin Z
MYAISMGELTSTSWVFTVAFAFGLAVIAMAYTIGPISGCHINPAISLAAYINKRISGKEFWLYILAQIIGALIGSGILFALVKTGVNTGGITTTGANNFAPDMLWAAIIAETVFTFIFILVVLGATDSKNNAPKFAGLAIGLSLILIHIVCIPITGTSVNPARSIAPAVFDFIERGFSLTNLLESGTALTNLWVFILCPLVGAVLAAFTWKGFKKECCCCKKEETIVE